MGCTGADEGGSFVFFGDMVNVDSAVASPDKATAVGFFKDFFVGALRRIHIFFAWLCESSALNLLASMI